MRALCFGGGFITGAASMLAVVLWVMSDREPQETHGWMTEWPND